MKQVFLAMAFLFLFVVGKANSVLAQRVKDGLYLIVKVDSTQAQRTQPANGIALKYSKLFEEFDAVAAARIVVDSNEYVPLDLKKSPTTEPDAAQKKKLNLTLTTEASELLRSFTTKHLARKMAVVVDGEVLAVQNVKESITNGQLQITKCTKKTCERLYFKLEDNVKK